MIFEDDEEGFVEVEVRCEMASWTWRLERWPAETLEGGGECAGAKCGGVYRGRLGAAGRQTQKEGEREEESCAKDGKPWEAWKRGAWSSVLMWALPSCKDNKTKCMETQFLLRFIIQLPAVDAIEVCVSERVGE